MIYTVSMGSLQINGFLELNVYDYQEHYYQILKHNGWRFSRLQTTRTAPWPRTWHAEKRQGLLT